MKAKFSSTSLLLVSLSVLLAWYGVYEKQFKPKKTAEETNSKRLSAFSKDEIQELEIAQGADSIYKLKRSNKDWLITSPVEDSADAGAVNSLLTTLTSTEQERTVEENPKSLEPFGLEKPSLILRSVKDAQTSQTIFVGNQTQVGSGVYVKTSSGNAVFKANRALLSSFQKSLFELRNKNLVELNKTELAEVEITNPTGQILLNRGSDDKWVLSREGGSPVDRMIWEKVLTTLVDLKAIAIASEKPEIQSYKIDKPLVRVVLSTGADKSQETLLFSRTNGKVYGKREDKPFIYELNKEILENLNKSASTFRDLHLASFNRFSVTKILIGHGTKTFELRKEGAVWSFAENKTGRKLDPGKVEKFLTDLQDSKVTALSDVKKPKDPVVVIEVFEKQNEKEISVAKLELFANGAGLALGMSNYLKGVWALPHKDLKQLNLTQEDFLESAPQKPEEKKS